ncbi:hypothetical protein Cpap_3962 [Ruminiclostridium papyrosolvens DSM 2782]|uniref:Uncharacterized protein n=1 Tax=Ruminiclostridium papyrosolvens DSM 2782 TaxID=588581 RepID=F1T7S8_9FIRM|nr:hypothetical protein [Ruminiclostridium papyrosolvens]EGD49526.1 hypothetical protein Cpap_3962 [Ruminiclostridium papyrosolvens DSM 2782]WES33351.1 hypothetical protein P0092_16500 [Ruminiclostridium papyrosolvens DSM 2782]
MKLNRKTKLTVIVVIAGVLILYGILDRIFSFNLNPKTVNNVGMVLMIVAFALLFSDNKRNNRSSTDETTDVTTDEQDKENHT